MFYTGDYYLRKIGGFLFASYNFFLSFIGGYDYFTIWVIVLYRLFLFFFEGYAYFTLRVIAGFLFVALSAHCPQDRIIHNPQCNWGLMLVSVHNPQA